MLIFSQHSYPSPNNNIETNATDIKQWSGDIDHLLEMHWSWLEVMRSDQRCSWAREAILSHNQQLCLQLITPDHLWSEPIHFQWMINSSKSVIYFLLLVQTLSNNHFNTMQFLIHRETSNWSPINRINTFPITDQ